MAKNDYTEDNIKTLEWVPHIRKRPGMYIGRSASARGLQLTTKSVARISATKPGWWNDAEGSGKGCLF